MITSFWLSSTFNTPRHVSRDTLELFSKNANRMLSRGGVMTENVKSKGRRDNQARNFIDIRECTVSTLSEIYRVIFFSFFFSRTSGIESARNLAFYHAFNVLIFHRV